MTQDQIVMALLLAARSAVATTLGERAEVVWPMVEPEARAAAEEIARELLEVMAAPTKGAQAVASKAGFQNLRELINAYGGEARKRMQEGTITIGELREAFADVKNREAEIVAAILRFPATAIAAYGRRDQTKEKNARSLYEVLLSSLIPLTTFAWSPFTETFSQAGDRMMREATDETIRAYAEEKRREREREEERKASLASPTTLAEYERAMRVRSLTPDETRTYDELVADAARAKMLAERTSKTEEREKYARASAKPESAASAAGARVVAGEHTRDKYPIWTVVLDARISDEQFRAARERAKANGGYYSSFRGGGAVPGFVFRDETKARTFASAYGGTSEATETASSAPEQTPEQKPEQTPEEVAAARLRDQAASLRDQANEALAKDRLANTARRASMAASAEWQARKQQGLAERIRLVADAVAAGNERLWPVKQKTHVEELERTLRQGRYETLREKSRRGERIDWEQESEAPLEDADLDSVKYPVPEIYADHVRSAATKAADRPGGKLAAKRLLKLAKEAGEDGYLRADDERTREDLQAVVDALPEKERWYGEPLREPLARYRRVHDAMGIRSLPHLRATLREYLRVTKGSGSKSPELDPLKKAERALVGLRIEGYVPTPNELAERVVRIAGVAPGLTVLEPSAGKGSLADAAREAGGIVSVVEQAETLRRVLAAKGHDLVGNDALDVSGTYDRIVMNPPFEKGQDMVHVRRAYEANLAPGGRLVAITSEGPFFRGDKQATEFRAWLESVGGQSERLPAGSFRGSDVSTDVATRLVVIDKP
jgi:hypothetical protein